MSFDVPLSEVDPEVAEAIGRSWSVSSGRWR
jgi:hypothetical protein